MKYLFLILLFSCGAQAPKQPTSLLDDCNVTIKELLIALGEGSDESPYSPMVSIRGITEITYLQRLEQGYTPCEAVEIATDTAMVKLLWFTEGRTRS